MLYFDEPHRRMKKKTQEKVILLYKTIYLKFFHRKTEKNIIETVYFIPGKKTQENINNTISRKRKKSDKLELQF